MYNAVLKDGRIRIDLDAVKLNTEKDYKRLVKDMLLQERGIYNEI